MEPPSIEEYDADDFEQLASYADNGIRHQASRRHAVEDGLESDGLDSPQHQQEAQEEDYPDFEKPAEVFTKAKVAPDFLSRNAQVHEWVFGAIAELVDNSIDSGATKVVIDLVEEPEPFILQGTTITPLPELHVRDDGSGMDLQVFTKMVAGFGKSTRLDGKTIGQYGIGFKSGSMRIGDDCVVLTKHESEMSIALLSQTFLKEQQKDNVEVPIVTWTREGELCTFDAEELLDYIGLYGQIDLTRDICAMFDALIPTNTGTHVIINHLKILEGEPELHKVENDIVLKVKSNNMIRTSLRAYLEVLYLVREQVKLFISRRSVVQNKVIKQLVSRRPLQGTLALFKSYNCGSDKTTVKLHCGYSPEAQGRGLCGLFLYYRNRLIKSYFHVGLMIERAKEMAGIVALADLSDFHVLHNKQEFSSDEKFRDFTNMAGSVIKNYWMKYHEKNLTKMPQQKELYRDRVDWVQCDACSKWRRLLKEQKNLTNFSEKWFCWMNADTAHNNCSHPEEKDHEGYNEPSLFVDTSEATVIKNEKRGREGSKLLQQSSKKPRLAASPAGRAGQSTQDDEEEEENEEQIFSATPPPVEVHVGVPEIWSASLFHSEREDLGDRLITHVTAATPMPWISQKLRVVGIKNTADIRAPTASELGNSFFLFVKPQLKNDVYKFVHFLTHLRDRQKWAQVEITPTQSMLIMPPLKDQEITEHYGMKCVPLERLELPVFE